MDEGHFVNTASMAGLTTAPFMSVYDVTKHAVVALSESMYKELAVTGAPIGVSVVCPGLIDTSIMRSSRNRPESLVEEGKAGPMAQPFWPGALGSARRRLSAVGGCAAASEALCWAGRRRLLS